jgi:hypothetical protein
MLHQLFVGPGVDVLRPSVAIERIDGEDVLRVLRTALAAELASTLCTCQST